MVLFDFFFCHQYYCSTYQAITVASVNSQFVFFPCLLILFFQTVDLSSTDKLFSNYCSCLSSYYCFHPCLSSLSTQAMTIFSIGKPIDYRSYLCFYSLSTFLSTFLFLSTSISSSNQISKGVDTPWIQSLQSRYSYNSSYCFNTKDNIKTMNQELFRFADWISLFVSVFPQKKFAELPIMDISIIDIASFNFLIQKASQTKDI